MLCSCYRSTECECSCPADAKQRGTKQIDLVRNKLQVVLFSTEIQDQDWRPPAQRAVQEIQNSLNRIEAECLAAN